MREAGCVGCPPLNVVGTVARAFGALFFACVFQQQLMASLYIAALFVALACYAIHRAALPRVDDALAAEVILGVERGAGDADAPLPPVFAHRGGGHDAPENTLAAIREAKRNNASGIEFDLSFTLDSVAVLFHDETLERTTNGEGPLAAITFEALRRLDAAAKHPFAERFVDERVPTLEEGVEECLRLGLRLILDVKEHDHRAVALVDELFRRRPELYRRALVASFYPQFIYALRRQNPGIVTALTWRQGFVAYDDIENLRPRFKSYTKHLLARVGDWLLDRALHGGLLSYLTGASAVLICKNVLSAEYVRSWRDQGMHLLAWTPNHPAEKDFLRKVLRVPIITDTLRHA
ncbi:glycerophosphodiester phosphodiesterase 1-like [Dermacentor albipictus]|uniref:glycerophosphodiester phosphodiesterase 1-like n=1 Tax=Dermacentor albipictus TaxID=60249 RepID=UPI0031FE3DB1